MERLGDSARASTRFRTVNGTVYLLVGKCEVSPSRSTGYLDPNALRYFASGIPPTWQRLVRTNNRARRDVDFSAQPASSSSRQRGGGARASTRADDGEAGEGRGPSVPVEEAEGLRLHLSRCSNTGYRGVTRCWHSAGRFRACRGDKCSRKDLGYFDTAVDAAVAVARSFAAEAAEKAEAEEEEGDHGGPSSSAARSRASRRREAPVCSYCSKSGSAQMRLHRCNNSHRCDGLLHPLCMERYLRVADLDDDVCLCKQCAEELQEDSD